MLHYDGSMDARKHRLRIAKRYFNNEDTKSQSKINIFYLLSAAVTIEFNSLSNGAFTFVIDNIFI